MRSPSHSLSPTVNRVSTNDSFDRMTIALRSGPAAGVRHARYVGRGCTRGMGSTVGGTGVYPPSIHHGIARAQPIGYTCTYGSQEGVPGTVHMGPRRVSQALYI